MESTLFDYDVFISAASVAEDLDVAKRLQDALRKHGLRSYLYTDNRIAEDFEEKVLGALKSSEYFIVLASPSACQSKWVKIEFETFAAYEKADKNRKIFRMKIDRGCDYLLPGPILHADTVDKLVPEVVHYHHDQRLADLKGLRERVKQSETQLAKRDDEAFGHYNRSRFWRPLVKTRDVHIFTCGRDTPKANESGGRGGRTTIDKWDYRTVLDITHFLNRHYPATHVTIEDPVSKLSKRELNEPSAPNRLARLHGLLRNKTCIIVGSPDVSDFAEIVLAETHKIDPYNPQRMKTRGFVIIKDEADATAAPSSHYWRRESEETAGVARVHGKGLEPFTSKLSSGAGEMYGILAVVANPFSDLPVNNRPRIVLLSGFSGVATNGIAKFLTDDDYLKEFGRFDRDYVDVNANIEVLIGVKFRDDLGRTDGDHRAIEGVEYCLTVTV